ncbi:hypothetical protein NKL07_17055 [Mesorhizobium sp. C280B]|uniref:hypothetical protein n=1 Tax=unclassified Mesorhizobium TaxID=325217 RepID=UPI0003CF2E52|nr:hypothetical protein [Mesorhizobium sp. LSJC280B00]ESW78941.1 hypothetical protein X772_28190 [Mesorhizobium sp. LSJC280B00]
MQDLISFLEANSALMLANPAAFASLAVLFGGGGFAVGRYLLTERLANLESRIARRDEEIAELKTGKKMQDDEPPMVPIVGTAAIGPISRSDPVALAIGRAQRTGPATTNGRRRAY